MKTAPVNKPSKTPLIIGAVLVIAIAGEVAIGVGSKKSPATNSMTMASPTMSTSANATATDKVTIASYAFGPSTITIKAGTTVTWTNNDAVSHTVTVDSGDGPKSPLFARGGTYTYTFAKAGTFTYHCEPHPYMKGTVVVTN